MKGKAQTTKIHYKGQEDDFLIFVEDLEAYRSWKGGDKTIPMSHFISVFKVYCTHKQGVQGQYDSAAKGTLESEFGTKNEEDVIKIILDKGEAQESTFPEHQAPKNDSMTGSIVTGQPGTR